MNAKRAMYSVRIDQHCTEGCEVLLLLPRTIHADDNPPPVKELERIRAENAWAARVTRESTKPKPFKRRV